MIAIFVLLQVGDLLTTLVGLQFGASEVSPFIGYLIRQLGLVPGVAIAMVIALGLAACCLWLGQQRVLRWVNVGFAVLCIWNLGVIVAQVA